MLCPPGTIAELFVGIGTRKFPPAGGFGTDEEAPLPALNGFFASLSKVPHSSIPGSLRAGWTFVPRETSHSWLGLIGVSLLWLGLAQEGGSSFSIVRAPRIHPGKGALEAFSGKCPQLLTGSSLVTAGVASGTELRPRVLELCV